MGCKLSVSVVHPESIVNKIKESISPTSKRTRKISDTNIKISPEPEAEYTKDNDKPPDSPDSLDTVSYTHLTLPTKA